jgi:N4-gp56 family major capsid protein
MAGLWYDSSDPEVISVWERDLGREVRARDPLFDPKFGFAGKSDGSLIQVKDMLTKGPGKSITTKLRYQLEGRGRAGDETLKGHGEAYKTSTYSLTVHTLRHYVETSSPIIDQWVSEDTMEEGRDGLADWFATRFAFSAHLHAGGFDLVTDPAYTLHNTINAVNSSYVIRPNGKTTAQDLTSGDQFDVDLLNLAQRQIKLLRPKIRPAMTPRGQRYCVFLSPEQVYSLRQSDSIWFATMQNALSGSVVDDNPLLSNALGEWGPFVFFESDWVPPGIHTSQNKIQPDTRRAWVGGAQALFLAFGRGDAPSGYSLNRYRWDRESEDFGHKRQVAATSILGMARPRYTKPGEANARENGIVVIETYAEHGMTDADVYAPWTDAGAEIAS